MDLTDKVVVFWGGIIVGIIATYGFNRDMILSIGGMLLFGYGLSWIARILIVIIHHEKEN